MKRERVASVAFVSLSHKWYAQKVESLAATGDVREITQQFKSLSGCYARAATQPLSNQSGVGVRGCYKLKWFNGLPSFFSGVSRGFDTSVIPIKELCCTRSNATIHPSFVSISLVLTEKTK
eukprot:scaffold173474_cov36-Cyclotella_meneghiniana.AAC.1